MSETERVIDYLNVAKFMLCNPKMLTSEMCVKIGQAINGAIALLKEQEPETVKEMLVVGGHLMGKCPKCSKILTVQDHPIACGFCGQEVKWE